MRRAFRILAFLSLFLSGPVVAVAEGDLFNEGNVKYRAGNYAEAAALYEKAVVSGRHTAAVYYNLGNAYFRAGRRGAAVVAYERAYRLDPRDRDIDWNRNVLKNALTDRIEDSNENVFISSVRRLLEWITVDEAAMVFAGLLGLLALLSVLNFLFHRVRSLTAGVGGFFVFLWLLSIGVFYFKWTEVRDPRAVVLDREAAARYGPSEKETKAFVLHEGAQAVVMDQTGDWYYIFLKNKNTGWIRKKSCEII